jgi:hypothetical protein
MSSNTVSEGDSDGRKQTQFREKAAKKLPGNQPRKAEESNVDERPGQRKSPPSVQMSIVSVAFTVSAVG